MPLIQVERHLNAVSEESPCGENLEYDPAFTELERIAEGVPEQAEGDKVTRKAEEPKWRDVFDNAEELLGRSRDLRLAVYMTHAGLNLEGYAALASGLELIDGLLRAHWDDVHPKLDEDDGDPTLRLNSLLALESGATPGRAEGTSFLRCVDRATLVTSRQLGSFSRRDIKLAKGEIALSNDDQAAVTQLAVIEAAFRDCDLEELTATAACVQASLDKVKSMSQHLLDKVGAERAPDFAALAGELEGTRRILTEQLAARGALQPAADGEAAEPDGAASGANGAGTAARAGHGTDIRTREDAVRMLDRVCEYFQKNEPSSPVPLLLQRAKRLVAKDFLEILRDLAPDGIAQAEAIRGADREA